tara:strand:+ start:779 stop:1939 length:1161 start_codon:yes stop_codon:yes gene_type:complete
MEMIDVLKRLKEIANKSPEVQNAISSTEAMNPKQQAAIAIAKKEKNEAHGGQHTTTGRSMTGSEMDKREKIVKGMKKDKAGFKKRYGKDADAVMYATATKQAMKNDVNEAPDTITAAQQAVDEYLDGDTLVKPKNEVIADLERRAKAANFPQSYELETAARMVADKYDDDGEEKYTGEDINTNTMETKDKKEVKEAIQMTADTPEEAGMLMQILKMAGVKPVDAKMMGMEPEHGSEMDPGEMNKQMDTPSDDDAMGSMDMGRMRNIVMKPDMEKQEETFANSPGDRPKAEPTVQDVDSLVNVHSGGLNRQKNQYRKEYPGDNPMAVAQEDKITEEELSNSLRTQYESFKKAYTEAAKPDYIDLDKDGNKTEPMKKAAKDKEAKEKK